MHLRFWLAAAVAAAADLITKSIAWKYLGAPEQGEPSVEILRGWFRLTTSENYGAVFGLGQGYGWFFVLMSIVAAVLLVWLLVTSRPERRMFHVWLGLILGGTVGNLYDRIAFGYVRDFFDFYGEATIGPIRLAWPYVFNLADVFLVLGVAGAIIAWLASGTKRPAALL